jgi:hypothetical protein
MYGIRLKVTEIGRHARPDTPRRVAAAARAIERQRESWGLFADQVDVGTTNDRLAKLHADEERWRRNVRHSEAVMLRDLRLALRALPEDRRAALVAKFNNGPLPKAVHYALDFLHQRGVAVPDLQSVSSAQSADSSSPGGAR